MADTQITGTLSANEPISGSLSANEGISASLTPDEEVSGALQVKRTRTVPTMLNDLGDVEVTDPQDGDELVYDETLGQWVNGAGAAGGTWGTITGTLSDQTDLQTELDKKTTEKTKQQYDALPSADKNDPDIIFFVPDYEDSSKTWVRLDDTTTASDKVWSSNKVASEIGNTAQIDDTTTGQNKTWSSTKIATEIDGKMAYSVNDTTETTLDNDDYVPFYDYSASARRKSTWSNIKAKLKSYFDGIYAALSHTHTKSQITDFAHTHTKSQITDFPTLGTASAKDVPTSGDASSSQVVMGNDTRLTDARTPTTHTHTTSQITDFPTLATVATTGDYDDLTDAPAVENPSSGGTTRSLVTTGEKYNWNRISSISRSNVTASKGDTVRIPSSGTDSRISPLRICIPCCYTSGNKPIKYSSFTVDSSGYANIVFAESVSGVEVALLIYDY